MNCAFFKFEENYPPRTSSTEFSTIPAENSISYIRKGITNTSFSKKSFSTISRAHERLKFNIYSIPRKYFESRDSPTKKKNCFGTSPRRSEVSIDSRINGGRVSNREIEVPSSTLMRRKGAWRRRNRKQFPFYTTLNTIVLSFYIFPDRGRRGKKERKKLWESGNRGRERMWRTN